MFSSKEVLERLEELDVLLVKADNTHGDPAINADLERYGENGRSNLPVNIIVPADPDQKLIIMPEFFGAGEALEALEQAAR